VIGDYSSDCLVRYLLSKKQKVIVNAHTKLKFKEPQSQFTTSENNVIELFHGSRGYLILTRN
jgi:hypothetical protein